MILKLNEWLEDFFYPYDEIEDEEIDTDSMVLIRFNGVPYGREVTIDKVNISYNGHEYVGTVDGKRVIHDWDIKMAMKKGYYISPYYNDILFGPNVDKDIIFRSVKRILTGLRRSISGKLTRRKKRLEELNRDVERLTKARKIVNDITADKIMDNLERLRKD